MKKIFKILLAAYALVSVSCVNDIEKVFDESASDRLNEQLLKCKELITGPEYGWLIRYYPSSERKWGGCTYAAKFETNGFVTITSDMSVLKKTDFSTEKKSHYSIKSSSSVVLSFDTYNEYLHYWADPDIPGENKMYGGDLEYAYVSGNENEMVFRGTKSENIIVFTPLEKDIVSTVRDIEPIYKYTSMFAEFTFSDGAGQSEVVEKTRDYNMFVLGEKNLSYVLTPDGIEFYEPFTICGVTIQSLAWTEAGFVSEEGITLEGRRSDRYQAYENFLGTYIFPFTTDDYTDGIDNEVEIIEGEREKTFIMRGLSWKSTEYAGYTDPGKPFDIELTYNPIDGTLTCYCQIVGTTGKDDEYNVILLPTNDIDWEWWPYTDKGISLKHNNPEDPADMVLTWDYVDEVGNPNCFMLGRYQVDAWHYAIDAYKDLTTISKKK